MYLDLLIFCSYKGLSTTLSHLLWPLQVDEMIENIRDLYIKTLENTNLLDTATSEIAIEKIKAMEKHVAFPNFVRNLTIIEETYSKVSSSVAGIAI